MARCIHVKSRLLGEKSRFRSSLRTAGDVAVTSCTVFKNFHLLFRRSANNKYKKYTWPIKGQCHEILKQRCRRIQGHLWKSVGPLIKYSERIFVEEKPRVKNYVTLQYLFNVLMFKFWTRNNIFVCIYIKHLHYSTYCWEYFLRRSSTMALNYRYCTLISPLPLWFHPSHSDFTPPTLISPLLEEGCLESAHQLPLSNKLRCILRAGQLFLCLQALLVLCDIFLAITFICAICVICA
jgi:hypothetical protein